MYQAIIIDDEKWVVKSLVSMIRDQTMFNVTEQFYDGLSGLDFLREYQPDLAFVDVRLPDISGLEILQAAQKEHLPTLFIVISGHAEFAYVQKAMLHNAICYCLKPFSHSELTDAMQKAYDILENRHKDVINPGLDRIQQQRDDKYSDIQPKNSDDLTFQIHHLTSHHPSVQKMIDFIEVHYKEDISIQDLASYCSMNANYASQLFKQRMGFSFVQYLKTLRIAHAQWLLSKTDETIFSIANEVGYSNYFYFAKVFKKETGLTPTEYRAEMTHEKE